MGNFGFSSFLHLQLPPQLQRRQTAPHRFAHMGQRSGVTSFIWKTDVGLVEDTLQCSGLLECELSEGFLYVFPQWVQHFVWSFRGPGERRTVAANISILGAQEALGHSGAALDPGDPRGATRTSRYHG